jgi:hypothetical protein
MKRLVLAASLAFALVGAGCDDDTTTPPADGGGDAKTDTATITDSGAVAGMCTGTFSKLTASTLKGSSTPGGKCTSDADLNYICTGDIATKARQCGVTCKSLGAPNLADCVSKCLQPMTSISSGCTDCYRDLVLCSALNCQECISDPNSAACMTCQVTKGCFGTFFACSGLPSGAPAPADAAVDAPVDAAKPDATVDAGGDAKVDAGPDATVDANVDGSVDAGADTADASADGSDGAVD